MKLNRLKNRKTKDVIIISIITLVLLILIETVCYFKFNNYSTKIINYDLALKIFESPKLFDKEDDKYHYSSYFPTRYYKSKNSSKGNRILKDKKDTFRVFVFGGSSVAGSPFGHWGSFANFLEDELRRKLTNPSLKVEVMNFGVSSIGSSKVRHIFEKAIKYSPDLVIFYMGNNELYDYVDLHQKKYSNLFFNFLYKNSYTFKMSMLFLEDLNFTTKKRLTPSFEGVHQSVNNNDIKKMNLIFEDNINSISNTANDNKINTLFMSQVINEITPPQKKLVAYKSFSKAIEQLKNKFYDKALLNLSDAIEKDTRPLRFKSSYKKILSRYTNKFVSYIDSQEFVRNQLSDKVLDGRLLIDSVHPNITANKYLAQSIKELYLDSKRKFNHLFIPGISNSFWKTSIKSEDYFLTCSRYLQEEMNTVKSCVETFSKKYINSKTEITRRLNSRYWEYSYYYGLLTKDKKALSKSYNIYNHPNR
jgi:hypothetical protein